MDRHAPGLCPSAEELEAARLELEGLLLPGTAFTAREKAVMERAVRLQAAHTVTFLADMPALPSSVRSFRIGHFQMQLGGRGDRGEICPLAYTLLLREGLLYRGVEGRRSPAPPAGQAPPPRQEGMRAEPGDPPLRPQGRRRQRDAWLPYRKRNRGNPPPEGVPPQGDPPLPGLPGRGRGKGV